MGFDIADASPAIPEPRREADGRLADELVRDMRMCRDVARQHLGSRWPILREMVARSVRQAIARELGADNLLVVFKLARALLARGKSPALLYAVAYDMIERGELQ